MSPAPDNLAGLKDDMIAFIEGHGMRRFHGYVDYEEVQSVVWKTEDNPDSWKDFVELAKAAAAPFLTMDSWTLRREELDQMIERLGHAEFTNDGMWTRRAGCGPNRQDRLRPARICPSGHHDGLRSLHRLV